MVLVVARGNERKRREAMLVVRDSEQSRDLAATCDVTAVDVNVTFELMSHVYNLNALAKSTCSPGSVFSLPPSHGGRKAMHGSRRRQIL